MARPTLFLIDGSSQMYRAYHAFRGRGLSNQEGHTTHAVYVFVTMLRKLINDHHPAYLAASFDLAGPTFRDQIVSIDKDFFQLVHDGVRVYDPREDGVWFDEQGVVEKFGVKPAQVVDVLALVGDTSDNVAGVPGIGKKGAVDLITQFGSLDALLERAAELKPKQRDALVN